jgi:hypothetical protein
MHSEISFRNNKVEYATSQWGMKNSKECNWQIFRKHIVASGLERAMSTNTYLRETGSKVTLNYSLYVT